MSDQDLEIRVQEIIFSGAQKRSDFYQCILKALRERYPGPESHDELLAAATKYFIESHGALLKAAKQKTLEIPDRKQGGFWEIPGFIFVEKDEDLEFIKRDVATIAEVKEWAKTALQFHSVQHLRFKRLIKDLNSLKYIKDETLWMDVGKLLKSNQREKQRETATA
jgi:hypothetical protein